MGPNRWIADLVAAAETKGWTVTRIDLRTGVTIEEPASHGLTLNISGRDLTPDFIAALPEARQPGPHAPSRQETD